MKWLALLGAACFISQVADDALTPAEQQTGFRLLGRH
jgi:hypothetical protein